MIVLTMLLAIASSCKKDHDIPTGKVFNEGSGGESPSVTTDTLDGAINGPFSVSLTQQVWFSQGNLQYKASTNTWRFAEHQWDYVGNDNSNISSTYSDYIDLFGWGTSGYNHGANCYQPWSTSISDSDYYAYGSSSYNLYDQSGQADWGYNAISNGGNTENSGWRTPTHDEWVYVFNTRSTPSGIRYAKAKVNDVNGVILLPDNWNSSYYSLSNTNQSGAGFTSNTITASQWESLEQLGAVFLPAAGDRFGTSVGYVGSHGYYWSASCSNTSSAWSVVFHDSYVYTDNGGSRYYGHSVRLVRSFDTDVVKPSLTTATPTNVTTTSATLGGDVTSDGGATVTERGVCWSTSSNPTLSGSHQKASTAGTGSFTLNITGLTPGTTYYVRAYAKNSQGTSYGDEVSFTTLELPSYTIAISADPSNGGNVTGGGTYQQGQSCTVTATANTGYTFLRWTENGTQVSTDASYTFPVSGNRTLVANFVAQLQAPVGAINGLFSVSATQQVYFSQGNLQYIGNTNTWKFADHQWDVIGTSQENNAQGTTRDLFGWGTSGYNHGANCYQPWSTSTSSADYYVYGSSSYNLYDQSGQADWGYNAISNGGNQENSGWRTPTQDEWEYVFTRSTPSGIRYAKAKVNNVNGVILLPDNWNNSYYPLSNTNQDSASYSVNTITISQWNTLEQHGSVFLPAAGYRYGTSVYCVGSYGYYWSASYLGTSHAWYVSFSGSYLITDYYYGRDYGQSVRLVRSAQ